jgi:hypothetical protein
MNNEKKTIHHVEIGDSEDALKTMLRYLSKDGMPDCVLLMEKDNFNRFEEACGKLGFDVEHFVCSKELKTA